MKHLIIAAIVCVGLVAESSTVSIDQQQDNGQAIAVIGSSPGHSPQQLSTQEMKTTIGGDNISGCWLYKDEVGDVHGICCLDLWILTICVGVNVSEIQRILDI